MWTRNASFISIKYSITVVFLAYILTACGGGGDTPTSAYNISGTISGVAIEGVTLTLTGGTTATSDVNGAFSFKGRHNGKYTATPTKTGYKFMPATVDVMIDNADVSGANFVSSGYFAKICNSGDMQGVGVCPADPGLGSNPEDWACTMDNATGLMWEVKTGANKSQLYTNYDSTTELQIFNGVSNPATAPTLAQVESGLNSVGFTNVTNTNALCGHSDWRLPSNTELNGIYAGTWDGTPSNMPNMYALWFPNMQASWYWSETPTAGNAYFSFVVYFVNGNAIDGFYRSYTDYVRLVRTGQ